MRIFSAGVDPVSALACWPGGRVETKIEIEHGLWSAAACNASLVASLGQLLIGAGG